MSVVDIRELQKEFVIYFGSEQSRINAYTLATTLVAIADAAKEANSLINPGYEVEVVVEALGSGSFKAKVRAVYAGINNLFSKENLKGIVLGVIASYIYQATLAPGAQVKIIVSDDQVVIEEGDKKIIVPRDVHEAVKQVERSEKFKQSVGRAFRAVEQDPTITSLGIARELADRRPLIEVPRIRFGQVSTDVELEHDARELLEVADLQIRRAILERSKRRWEFVWRGVKISAPVLDDRFYDDFFAHRITIAPGDVLQVKMKIFQSKDADTGIFLNTRYEIIEVVKHIPRMEQVSASF